MKKFFKEFKEFISKGSVLNLAVGLIIGSAFTAIVNSLVGDLLMPLISLLGKTEINDWKVVLQPAILDVDNVTILKAEIALYYGRFLQATINFVLIAFVLFLIIKVVASVNESAAKIKKAVSGEEEEAVEPEPAPEPEPVISEETKLLMEIRDALVKDKK